MSEDFINARLATTLEKAKRLWVEDCQQLQAQMSLKGQYGGSMSLDAAIRAFEPRLTEAVLDGLAGIAKMDEGRGRSWYRAHEKFEELMIQSFVDVPDIARNMMLSGPIDDGEIEHRFDLQILEAKAEIGAHSAGWSAPAQRSWPERHPIRFALLTSLMGFVLGLAIAPASTAIEGALSIDLQEAADD